jgi:hypothetical protein
MTTFFLLYFKLMFYIIKFFFYVYIYLRKPFYINILVFVIKLLLNTINSFLNKIFILNNFKYLQYFLPKIPVSVLIYQFF